MEYTYKTINVNSEDALNSIDHELANGGVVDNLWSIGDNTIITFSYPVQ